LVALLYFSTGKEGKRREMPEQFTYSRNKGRRGRRGTGGREEVSILRGGEKKKEEKKEFPLLSFFPEERKRKSQKNASSLTYHPKLGGKNS